MILKLGVNETLANGGIWSAIIAGVIAFARWAVGVWRDVNNRMIDALLAQAKSSTELAGELREMRAIMSNVRDYVEEHTPPPTTVPDELRGPVTGPTTKVRTNPRGVPIAGLGGGYRAPTRGGGG